MYTKIPLLMLTVLVSTINIRNGIDKPNAIVEVNIVSRHCKKCNFELIIFKDSTFVLMHNENSVEI